PAQPARRVLALPAHLRPATTATAPAAAVPDGRLLGAGDAAATDGLEPGQHLRAALDDLRHRLDPAAVLLLHRDTARHRGARTGHHRHRQGQPRRGQQQGHGHRGHRLRRHRHPARPAVAHRRLRLQRFSAVALLLSARAPAAAIRAPTLTTTAPTAATSQPTGPSTASRPEPSGPRDTSAASPSSSPATGPASTAPPSNPAQPGGDSSRIRRRTSNAPATIPPAIGRPSSNGPAPDTAESGRPASTGTPGSAPSVTCPALTVVPAPTAHPAPTRQAADP